MRIDRSITDSSFDDLSVLYKMVAIGMDAVIGMPCDEDDGIDEAKVARKWYSLVRDEMRRRHEEEEDKMLNEISGGAWI